MAAIGKKIHSIVTITLTGVITQIMHLKSSIVLYKLQKLKFDNVYKILILSKRSRSLLKMKQARERSLKRKNRSCWFKSGRTDLWWQNITTGVALSDAWKKNFRLPRLLFMDLVSESSPYVSPDPFSPNSRALLADKKLDFWA